MGVQHKVHSISAETQARVRAKRNKLLDEIDIVYCNADKWETMDESTKEKWRKYKDRLRQIPEHPGFPHHVKWPESPVAEKLTQ